VVRRGHTPGVEAFPEAQEERRRLGGQ